MDACELRVPSERYGETICVVDIASFLKGRRLFPCGDGSDYRLRNQEAREIFSRIRQYGKDTYENMSTKHTKEVHSFPMAFAFNSKQFEDGMRKLGLEPNETGQVMKIPGGGFIRRSDADRFNEMFARHAKERQEAMDGDLTGDGYIYGMFYHQLNNTEYTYTNDPEDAFDALGLSWNDVNGTPKLLHGFSTAADALRKADIFG